jgi:chromosome segregation ATPase
MDEKEALIIEIQDIERSIIILTRQIDNGERNITGLIAQQTRYMDRRDMLEAKKAELEAKLAALPPEEEAGA